MWYSKNLNMGITRVRGEPADSTKPPGLMPAQLQHWTIALPLLILSVQVICGSSGLWLIPG